MAQLPCIGDRQVAARLPRGAMDTAFRSCFSELVFTASQGGMEERPQGGRPHLQRTNISGWWFQVILKYMLVKLDHFPR